MIVVNLPSGDFSHDLINFPWRRNDQRTGTSGLFHLFGNLFNARQALAVHQLLTVSSFLMHDASLVPFATLSGGGAVYRVRLDAVVRPSVSPRTAEGENLNILDMT